MANFALIAPAQQWVDANGDPRSGYKLFTYENRTSTKKTTYTTAAGGVANANPITLDSTGRCPNGVFGSTGAYTLLLAPPGAGDPPSSTTWSMDDVEGINDATTSVDQWIALGVTPTYVGATSFTMPGDQTSILQIGRRLKTQNSGGTIYSTITNSVYGVVTTVTVANDSGTLDSGLSSVSYGILSSSNPSIPTIINTPTVTPDNSADFVAFLDSSAGVMGKALVSTILAPAALATNVATTSGSTINLVASGLASIPYWQIIISFDGVSMNGTEDLLIQLSDNTGFVTSGYNSWGSQVINAAATAARFSSAGFIVMLGGAGYGVYGDVVLTRRRPAASPSGDYWSINGNLTGTGVGGVVGVSGLMQLNSATPVKTLDGIRITRSGGANTFDAGSISVYGRLC